MTQKRMKATVYMTAYRRTLLISTSAIKLGTWQHPVDGARPLPLTISLATDR